MVVVAHSELDIESTRNGDNVLAYKIKIQRVDLKVNGSNTIKRTFAVCLATRNLLVGTIVVERAHSGTGDGTRILSG